MDPQHDAQLDYYGKRLATCSSDRTVKVYDVTGEVQNNEQLLTGCVCGAELLLLGQIH